MSLLSANGSRNSWSRNWQGTESVGVLNPVSVRQIAEEQNLDELESIS